MAAGSSAATPGSTSRAAGTEAAAVAPRSEPLHEQRQPDLDAVVAAVRHRRHLELRQLEADRVAAQREVDPGVDLGVGVVELDVAVEPHGERLAVAGADAQVGAAVATIDAELEHVVAQQIEVMAERVAELGDPLGDLI